MGSDGFGWFQVVSGVFGWFRVISCFINNVSQLPIGITPLELREAFAFFGEIVEVNYITKVIQGRRIDTGDRVLIFKQVRHHIPSYIFVRGCRAYVNYAGQPQTCRICGLTGHFAKDCHKSQKEAGQRKLSLKALRVNQKENLLKARIYLWKLSHLHLK